MTAAVERAKSFRQYINRQVRVTLRSADKASGQVPVVLTGEVMAVALRVKGHADWNGNQFDLVLACDDRAVRVFALTRVESIEAAD